MMKCFLTNMLNIKTPFFCEHRASYRCNSKCIFCHFWRKDSLDKNLEVPELNTEEELDFVNQMCDLGLASITFDGGEPLLRNDLEEILALSEKKGVVNSMVTNGIILDKKLEKIAPHLNLLAVSLDTLNPKKYRKLRGVDAFHVVIKNIRKAVEVAKDHKDLFVAVTFVITKDNIEEIPSFIEFCLNDLNVNGAGFQIVNDFPDMVPDKESLNRTLSKLLELVNSGIPIMNTRTYFNMIQNYKFEYRCKPYIYLFTDCNGDITLPCTVAPGIKKFNIRDSSLKDIWTSQEAKDLFERYSKCSKCRYHCVVESSLMFDRIPHLGVITEWVKKYLVLRKWKQLKLSGNAPEVRVHM